MPWPLPALRGLRYLAADACQRALDFDAGFGQVLGERQRIGTVHTVAVESDGAGVRRIGDQHAAGADAVGFCIHRSKAGAQRAALRQGRSQRACQRIVAACIEDDDADSGIGRQCRHELIDLHGAGLEIGGR